MHKFSISVLAAALVMPFVGAAPHAETGTQTSPYWYEVTTIAVQGGTSFQLHGIAGDFDILFYDDAGRWLGWSLSCGADSGIVPIDATVGIITKWDDLGEVLPCAGPVVGVPSVFVYVDGY